LYNIIFPIFPTVEKDNLSLDSSNFEQLTSVQPTTDSLSLASEDTFSVASSTVTAGGSIHHHSAGLWRGSKAVARCLQPPVVERRNVFALYSNMTVFTRL
jgi:hypothetical protein